MICWWSATSPRHCGWCGRPSSGSPGLLPSLMWGKCLSIAQPLLCCCCPSWQGGEVPWCRLSYFDGSCLVTTAMRNCEIFDITVWQTVYQFDIDNDAKYHAEIWNVKCMYMFHFTFINLSFNECTSQMFLTFMSHQIYGACMALKNLKTKKMAGFVFFHRNGSAIGVK